MPGIRERVEKSRIFFSTGETRDIAYRVRQLQSLRQVLLHNEDAMMEALSKDLGKPPVISFIAEIRTLYKEIDLFIKMLSRWSKPKKVKTPVFHIGAKSMIYREPYGVVLIIAPWNYPLQLSLLPAIGALGAGNTVIIKPSEQTPHVSALLAKMIESSFCADYFTVIQGDVQESRELIKEKFDYIFFTGSCGVAKEVMKAAAENLTPVTLELSGKNPCIVSKDANLALAARRIVWGKFINAGQTCIAPDYVFVHRQVKEQLVDHIKHYIQHFYGENPLKSADFGRIINKKHFHRLKTMMTNQPPLIGGEMEEEVLYFAPTVLQVEDVNSPWLHEEIFGPILPICGYDHEDDVVVWIKEQHKPLALYLFTKNKQLIKKVIEDIQYGGGCINDTIIHADSFHLPFGGIGNSGMGSYHGWYSFDTFSHSKSIMAANSFVDLPFRYPPYPKMTKWIKTILRRL